MNTPFKLGFATLLLTTLFFSCKQAQTSAEEAAITEAAALKTDSISHGNPVNVKTPDRKFIRTATIKFKVKNVRQSTDIIENVTQQYGGFVTYTNLQSSISEKNETKISQDSTLETTRYSIENNLTIRVPNSQLDVVIKTMANEIDFLDSRVIKADDVSLQLLANRLAQSRSTQQEKRIAKAIDTKGKKLNTIIDAEHTLAAKKEGNDAKKIENLSLEDQVAFSTLTLQIYQRETIKREVVANLKNTETYRPHIGLQILDALKTGWYLLETIIAFVVQLWSVLLLSAVAVYVYKKQVKK